MKVNVNIDRLVIEGGSPDRRQVPLLQHALQAELTRLLVAEGRRLRCSSGGAVPVVRTPAIQQGLAAGPAQWGMQVARAVHGAIKG